MTCNLNAVVAQVTQSAAAAAANGQALSELFELYLLYDVVDTYASSFLKYGVVSSQAMREQHTDKLFELLKKVRVNAVALVDSFDLLDSNLCIAFCLFYLN